MSIQVEQALTGATRILTASASGNPINIIRSVISVVGGFANAPDYEEQFPEPFRQILKTIFDESSIRRRITITTRCVQNGEAAILARRVGAIENFLGIRVTGDAQAFFDSLTVVQQLNVDTVAKINQVGGFGAGEFRDPATGVMTPCVNSISGDRAILNSNLAALPGAVADRDAAMQVLIDLFPRGQEGEGLVQVASELAQVPNMPFFVLDIFRLHAIRFGTVFHPTFSASGGFTIEELRPPVAPVPTGETGESPQGGATTSTAVKAAAAVAGLLVLG